MMAIPIDVCNPDDSNLPDILKKIIFCCTKMENAIAAGKAIAFDPIHELIKNHPTIYLISDDEPLDFCPFCGTKIEIRPS